MRRGRGTDNWEWPDTLDAVAAAPAHHVVLLENEHVRVLEARVEAGDTVPLDRPESSTS